MASSVGRVKDLIVEYGEVEGKTETDRMRRGELSLCDIGGALGRRNVRLERLYSLYL